MMININQSQDNKPMRPRDILLPLLFFFLGLYLLQQLPLAQIDPIQQMNEQTAPLLERLVQLKYFRIIRLNVNEQCKLGLQQKICRSKSCTVCRCNDKDIPQFWTNNEKVKSHVNNDLQLWADERQQIKNGWVWHVEDQANDKGQYFDIHTNIQSYTNYNGSYIWNLIYEENCFRPKEFLYDQMCIEEQILYNVISGLHTSISTHLSRFYKNTTEPSAWADLRNDINQSKFHFNQSQYQRRVLEHPHRIKNLMFLYRILGKAIEKSANYFHKNFTIQSDNFSEDMQSRQILDKLLQHLRAYDLSPQQKEVLKFFNHSNPKVKQYQKYIHNISDILNCVECQKCRVFGKMQTYGVGTALKILLGYPSPYKRNEIVALFNVFNKISMSVDTYYQQRKQTLKNGYQKLNKTYIDAYKIIAGFLTVLYVWLKYKKDYLNDDAPKKQDRVQAESRKQK